ncbi:hypothetical protein H0H81_004299 [Sphagnurus paluster]|uniref:Ras modification protein ERF4 n=1 Tax=Sphagnurus paluster TaxID=117069 RepID=A0A9P7KN06_9AGAR|nr:hypothetical protein H0H81_004299 [Sphagnurus paluster]
MTSHLPQRTTEPVQYGSSQSDSHPINFSSGNSNEVNLVLPDDSVLQEKSLTESEEIQAAARHVKRFSLAPPGVTTPPSTNTDGQNGYLIADEGSKTIDDPLRTVLHDRPATQDIKVVVEEGDIGDLTGENLYSNMEKKASPATSRRASHLHLNLKPPSPQPWELIDPPESNDGHGREGGQDYYSTMGSRKFQALQDGINTRALIPKSSYYFGPPASDSAYGTRPVGRIGVHHPREIIRIERDYTGGELVQFAPIYPLELEGRITPTHFLETINAINELLISAYSLRHSLIDNVLAVFTLQLSRLFVTPHYTMRLLQQLIETLNVELYNPVGLNILWPRNVAFLYVRPLV